MKSPADLGLPFASWRPGQRAAIRAIQFAKTRHVVINAPTGAGKSAIATALPKLDERRRHVILTGTKALQDQYSTTTPFLSDLRGMSNYACLALKDQFADHRKPRRRSTIMCDDGPCRAGLKCDLKQDGCLYFDARRAFVSAHAGLTNYSAWLMNRRVGMDLGPVDVLCCDEAHALPEQLMSAFGVTISSWLIDTRRPPTTLKQWRQWAADKMAQLEPGTDDDSRVKRERAERALVVLAKMDTTWAWERNGDGEYRFEPTVPRLLLPLLGVDTIGTVAYLSATITPATLHLLDVPEDDITFESIPSAFPLDRRPIYVVPGARVDFRTMQNPDVVARWLDTMADICDLRNDRRGLIHTVSFDRAAFIGAGLTSRLSAVRPIVVHQRGESGAAFVSRFRSAGPNALALSPSLTTGFDFKYADAEFQIVAKIPFPDTRSPIMKARIKHTDRYRDHATMTALVQTCGRINRAADDSGETFIVDEHFHWWYRDNKDLAPPSFDEALVITRKHIRPLAKWAA